MESAAKSVQVCPGPFLYRSSNLLRGCPLIDQLLKIGLVKRQPLLHLCKHVRVSIATGTFGIVLPVHLSHAQRSRMHSSDSLSLRSVLDYELPMGELAG